MDTLEARTLVNSLWALAKLGIVPDPGFLEAWQARSLEEMQHFSGQNVASALWALAKLQVGGKWYLLWGMFMREALI